LAVAVQPAAVQPATVSHAVISPAVAPASQANQSPAIRSLANGSPTESAANFGGPQPGRVTPVAGVAPTAEVPSVSSAAGHSLLPAVNETPLKAPELPDSEIHTAN
jgi:hypothetical protein